MNHPDATQMGLQFNPDKATINPSGVKGLWIPQEILHAPDLSWQEKILLTYIYHLDSDEHHCYASNKYLGELMGCKEKTIANVMSSLKTKGVVETVIWDGRVRKIKATLC